MRNKRKTFRLIVMMTMALVLTAGSAVTSSAASFSDVPNNAWYKADLDEMDKMSIEEVRTTQKERLAAFRKMLETSAMQENSARDSQGAIRSNGDTGHDSSENQ